VVEASAAVDLTIAGMSRAWGIERQTLGRHRSTSDSVSLFSPITRRYSQVTSHLASVLQVQTAKRSLTQTSLSWSMSSHFNLKSLTFMGGDRFVLLLFNRNRCGKAKLKAPAPIDGRYRLLYSKFAQLS